MAYTIETTKIPGVLILTPRVFEDDRGFFFESFNQSDFNAAVGSDKYTFVQDNHSRSVAGTLRGLHFQNPNPQGKLMRVTAGAVFDVAVDIRKGSPTFGEWVGVELSASNKRQVWVPPGLAHGFVTVSDSAEFLYKVTDFYAPASEHTLLWSDEAIGVAWPLPLEAVKMSAKDKVGLRLNEIKNELLLKY